jgi:hypothetical protein
MPSSHLGPLAHGAHSPCSTYLHAVTLRAWLSTLIISVNADTINMACDRIARLMHVPHWGFSKHRIGIKPGDS